MDKALHPPTEELWLSCLLSGCHPQGAQWIQEFRDGGSWRKQDLYPVSSVNSTTSIIHPSCFLSVVSRLVNISWVMLSLSKTFLFCLLLLQKHWITSAPPHPPFFFPPGSIGRSWLCCEALNIRSIASTNWTRGPLGYFFPPSYCLLTRLSWRQLTVADKLEPKRKKPQSVQARPAFRHAPLLRLWNWGRGGARLALPAITKERGIPPASHPPTAGDSEWVWLNSKGNSWRVISRCPSQETIRLRLYLPSYSSLLPLRSRRSVHIKR